MFINRDSSNHKKSKLSANLPRSQSHKKTLSTIPKERKERVIEIEETPMDSNRYLQKSLQLQNLRKNHFNKTTFFQKNQNSNRFDDEIFNHNVLIPNTDNRIIKIEENFTSENESSHNFYLKDKDFVYSRGNNKRKDNFSGSFTRKSHENKNCPETSPLKTNNLNYVNKYSTKKKNYEDVNNFMKNKILYPELNNKKVYFSKNKEKENSKNHIKNQNNTILTSLISNTVNTNFNKNKTFDDQKNSSAHISFSNFVKTNSDINIVNLSKDIDRDIGITKDPVNMIIYFNNYILTNQSKVTNDDNSFYFGNKNPSNIYCSEFEDRENLEFNSFAMKNTLDQLNNQNHLSINKVNSFRNDNTIRIDQETKFNNYPYKLKDDDLTENSKNIPAYFYTKASKINERKESNNCLLNLKSSRTNFSKNSKNINLNDSYGLNLERELKNSIVYKSNLRESIRNKTASLLNSIDDFNSFPAENKSIMQPQQLENSFIYDLVSKYSGISIKKIDYKTIKKQKYIDENKSILNILNFRA